MNEILTASDAVKLTYYGDNIQSMGIFNYNMFTQWSLLTYHGVVIFSENEAMGPFMPLVQNKGQCSHKKRSGGHRHAKNDAKTGHDNQISEQQKPRLSGLSELITEMYRLCRW